MKNKKNENMTHCEIKRQKANIKGVYSQKFSEDLSLYSQFEYAPGNKGNELKKLYRVKQI